MLDMDYLGFLLANIPRDNFEGLTTNEMVNLLRYPFDKNNSPMLLNKKFDAQLIKDIHFYKDVVKYLSILKKVEPVKLTQKGNLPLFFCRMLIDEGIYDRFTRIFLHQFPLKTELDSPHIHTINIITRVSGLTRKKYGKLTLTKKAIRYLKSNSIVELYLTMLVSFATKCNWEYFDYYPSSPIIQERFGFTIFLVQKYGNESRKFQFYSDKYLRAFPRLIIDFLNNIKRYQECYFYRVIERFLDRFGLIEIERDMEREFNVNVIIKKTRLIEQIFRWQNI